MPLVDITKPEIINFLVESYDKTARLRLRWNQKNEAKLRKAATFIKEEQGFNEIDVLKAAAEGGMAAITRDHVSSGYNRRKTPIRDGVHINGKGDLRKDYSIPKVGLGNPSVDPRLARPDTDLSLDPVMRPVDPKHWEIIYKGIPDDGREVYLFQRNHLKPEDKYYFQECGGWEYGWRLKDSFFGRQGGSALGRVFRLTHGTKSRTGPQPDPSYYKSSDSPGVAKCLTD